MMNEKLSSVPREERLHDGVSLTVDGATLRLFGANGAVLSMTASDGAERLSPAAGAFTLQLLARARWPHPRRRTPSVSNRRLEAPTAALRQKAEALLFEIGRAILGAYGCFEE